MMSKTMMFKAMRRKICGMALAGVVLLGGAQIAALQAPLNTAQSLIKPADIRITITPSGKRQQSVSGDAGVAGRAVTADDPARIASISKLVVGLAVMRLVDQGKIDLDRDVSDYLGWRLRHPAFRDAKITMRLLLSHQSSITDGADYILPLDGDLASVAAKPEAWNMARAPGSWFSYANFNFPIVAATMEGATGKRFDVLMDQLVLKPLRLDACYNWQTSCSKHRRAQAITLLRPTGVLAKDAALARGETECAFVKASDGGCDVLVYKLTRNGSAFSPQGGLRISANDLVRIGGVIRNKGRPILSRKAFTEMTRTQWVFDGKNGDDDKGYFAAFGLSVHRLPDGKGSYWWGHPGEAYSLRSGLWVNEKTGEIRVRIRTMVDEFAAVGHCLDACP